MAKSKTPITYWGGKQMMVPRILPRFPEHTTYVEPFVGGGAVFWAKEPSEVEVINDLNRMVVNFYQQVECNFEALQQRIRSTLHSRSLYKDAMVMYENPHMFSELDLALAFYILCNQGFSGQIGSWALATSVSTCEKKTHRGRENFTAHLKDRLGKVQVECHDALYIIRQRDRETTFFYLDPPYFNSDMGHYGGYTRNDFEALLQQCAILKGKFLLSSYPSDLLSEYTKAHGWSQVAFDVPLPAGQKKKRKVEVLTANYDITQPRGCCSVVDLQPQIQLAA
jgi:DNA adenine methylase